MQPAPAQCWKRMASRNPKMRSATVVHNVPQPRDVARIFTDKPRPDFVLDQHRQRRIVTRTANRRLGLADTNDAALGLDPHESAIERFRLAEVGRVLLILRDRHMYPVSSDRFDFHNRRHLSYRPAIPAFSAAAGLTT